MRGRYIYQQPQRCQPIQTRSTPRPFATTIHQSIGGLRTAQIRDPSRPYARVGMLLQAVPNREEGLIRGSRPGTRRLISYQRAAICLDTECFGYLDCEAKAFRRVAITYSFVIHTIFVTRPISGVVKCHDIAELWDSMLEPLLPGYGTKRWPDSPICIRTCVGILLPLTCPPQSVA